MDDKRHKKEWAVVLFGLFLFVYMPPFLGIYDVPAMILGVPLSYFALFGLWGALIAAVAWGTRPRRNRDSHGEDGTGDTSMPGDGGA